MDPFNPITIIVVTIGAAAWLAMFLSSWGLRIRKPGDVWKGLHDGQ